jgi:DNA-binding CsgD family transcriptional regulator
MERLLAAAEELAAMGSWQLDLRTMDAVWSDGMYRIHGLEPGSISPGVEMLLSHTHPDDRQRLGKLLASVVKQPDDVPDEGLVADYRAQRPDGTAREVRFSGRVERDAVGRPARWLGAAQDVTDQRLTERELHAHYAVSQALRDWESFEEGVVGLLRRLGTALEYQVGMLWLWDEARERLVPRAYWTAPDVDAQAFEEATSGVSMASGQGIPGRVWANGQPAVVEDVSEDLRTVRREAAVSLGLRSAVAFAAVGDDGPLAVLTFYTFDLRPASERLVRTLTGIGRELGRFLAQRRGELGTRRLTGRELQVLQLAAEGSSGPEIAERLFVSPATIKTHFQHIYEKLGVGDRAAAVAHALRTGLIR